ncbi:hypothetical protein [Conexibacter sp. CPCC 206217]|uniref:hypothetical protein n=1 Tax=Conexibacter sp. CPCC 206217 TaxID=3064574 RepID=UPI002716B7D2|nr:hypothetical protein [Conexibacter sp. CPCC 206217]MDO8210528.1 hypothetical protein [Conexibacter sp. CPCC 206217]
MTPINATDVVGRAFAIYKEHAAPLLAAAFAVFFITAVASFVLDHGFLLILVAYVISLVAHTFYKGMVVRLVDDVRDGTLDASVGDLFRSVAPVAVPLLLASILLGILITIGLFIVIVPGLFLMTIWAVVAPAIVLEGRGVFDGMSRSWELVKGNSWQVFGVIVIIFLLEFGLGIVGAAIGAIGGDVTRAIVQLAVVVLVAPLSALATSVLYFALLDAHGTVPTPAASATTL